MSLYRLFSEIRNGRLFSEAGVSAPVRFLAVLVPNKSDPGFELTLYDIESTGHSIRIDPGNKSVGDPIAIKGLSFPLETRALRKVNSSERTR